MSGAFPDGPPPAPRDVLESLLSEVGLPVALADNVDLTGSDPVLPSTYAVGSVAQPTIAAAAAGAAHLWTLRGGRPQDIAVDMLRAALEYRSERIYRLNGNPAARLWDKVAGTYRCGDGRWVRLHTNFPHHLAGILDLLDCGYEREEVQAALDGWDAAAFEDAVAERGLVATMMRSTEDWLATPQGQALAEQPLVGFERIGEAPPQPLGPAERPLAGLRVLDLTRIIAGPVCGRTLAVHGADVLRIASPKLPFVEPLVIDTGRGKLSAHADLATLEGRETLEALLREADVFVQGYRPGGIAERGFSAEQAAELRPGIVYVSLCAYGYEGPWAERRGFDSLVQTVSGINHEEAGAAGIDAPKELPCQALDHASGYLMALGAMAGLKRRAEQGGSWHVRVSLARTGRWLQSLGRLPDGLDCPEPEPAMIAGLLEAQDCGFGQLAALPHTARLSETPARWDRPVMPLGSHPPRWPD